MPAKAILTTLVLFFLSACNFSPYSISVNNNVVYSSTGVIEEEIFSDASLQACVNNYLAENPDRTLTSIEQLTCTNAEIVSLIGLDRLPGLVQLDLSSNAIVDVSPVSNLENLRILRVSENRIRNVSMLNNMPLLNFIDLGGNSNIPCNQLDRLENRLGNSLRRPLSCSR